MHDKRLEAVFFTVLITGAILLSFFVFRPYLAALFGALVLAIVSRPVFVFFYKRLGGRAGLASFITIIVVIVALLAPLFVFGFLLFEDVGNLYLAATDPSSREHFFGRLDTAFEKTIGPYLPSGKMDVAAAAAKFAGSVFKNLDRLFSSFFKGVVNFFVLVAALFFLLRDGEKLRKELLFLSPLADSYDKSIIDRVEKAVSSVVRGSLLVALVQGMLAAVGFAIVGFPNPILFGALSAVAALIPSVGTALVIVPASVYLFFEGTLVSALGLLLWGVLVVGLIDNVLRPVLIERGLQIHPFLIFLSVIGGLSFFGPIGFVAGPVVLSLLVTLLGIYPVIVSGGGKML